MRFIALKMSDPEGAERREKEKESKAAGVCRGLCFGVMLQLQSDDFSCEQAPAAVTRRVNESNYSQE